MGMSMPMSRLENWKRRNLMKKEKKQNKHLACMWPSCSKLILVNLLAKYYPAFSCIYVLFEPLLGCECAYVCHNLWTEKKKASAVNSQHIKEAIAIQVTSV